MLKMQIRCPPFTPGSYTTMHKIDDMNKQPQIYFLHNKCMMPKEASICIFQGCFYSELTQVCIFSD